MPNPLSDFWDFLIGNTPDHNEQEDPTQRTASHLATWFLRVLIGGMWFQGMLWKLPLPASEGLRYWVEQMGERAALAPHRELVRDVYLPRQKDISTTQARFSWA